LRPSLAFSYIYSDMARHSSSGHQPNFPALSRGRHLYSAGWSSRWASADILVLFYFFKQFYVSADQTISAAIMSDWDSNSPHQIQAKWPDSNRGKLLDNTGRQWMAPEITLQVL